MVCDRCKAAVNAEFEKVGVTPDSVKLGEVHLSEMPTPDAMVALGKGLTDVGFELIDDRRSKIIERIKNAVVELVHYKDEPELLKQSEYISSKLNYDYHYLSKLFSEVECITIEQYIINQKIERVKELLTYGQLNLNEIAYKMGYSSVQHLSLQFKKITGMTSSEFKQMKENSRRPLDKI